MNESESRKARRTGHQKRIGRTCNQCRDRYFAVIVDRYNRATRQPCGCFVSVVNPADEYEDAVDGEPVEQQADEDEAAIRTDGGQLRVIDDLGPTRDGGSCAECGGGYRGRPFTEGRGRRLLVETEPGVAEPINVCPDCRPEAAE